MGKRDSLNKLLAAGSSLIMVEYLVGKEKGVTSDLGRTLLITSVGSEGFSYIIAEPNGLHETGDRFFPFPDEEDLTVGREGFTLVEQLKGAEPITRKFKITAPPDGVYPDGSAPSPDMTSAARMADDGGPLDEVPLERKVPGEPPAETSVKENSKTK